MATALRQRQTERVEKELPGWAFGTPFGNHVCLQLDVNEKRVWIDCPELATAIETAVLAEGDTRDTGLTPVTVVVEGFHDGAEFGREYNDMKSSHIEIRTSEGVHVSLASEGVLHELDRSFSDHYSGLFD